MRYHLLEYLMSPTLVRSDVLGYSDLPAPHGGKQDPPGVRECLQLQPSQAHLKLLDEAERKE
jgi:hypothetical protein